ELYAEMINDTDDETATYGELKAVIIRKARKRGIDVNRLRFWYDHEEPEQKIVDPGALPSELIGVTEVAAILDVSKAHVSNSSRRAQKAKEEGRKYRGKIPPPDTWISGSPYWFRE